MSSGHAIAISTQADTELNAPVVILFNQVQYILPLSETKSKPETIGHFISKTKTHENITLRTRTAQPRL